MPVHHIDVQHTHSGCFDFGDLIRQPREISRENGREDLDHERTKVILPRAEGCKPPLCNGLYRISQYRVTSVDDLLIPSVPRRSGVDLVAAL